MNEFLKLFIVNMSRLIPLPEFMKVIERNKRGTNLVGDPVVLNNVIEWMEIEICRALVERFRNRLNDQNVIERGRIIKSLCSGVEQKRTFAGPPFPLLNDLQRSFI